MKKGVLVLFVFGVFLFSLNGVFAESCAIDVSLLSQDPYPAVPGEYVKLVFQIDGIQNIECGTVEFELNEYYPIEFDSGQQKVYFIESGTYTKSFESFFLATYRVRVSDDALGGDNEIEVKYRYGKNLNYNTKEFNLDIENIVANFEVHVENYDALTNIVTFEILNIGETDVEALTIEIPKQDNIFIKGSNRNIEGDLDQNDYLSTDFEATLEDGEIKINIYYTDKIHERRLVKSIVKYDSSYFVNRLADQPKDMTTTYGIVTVIGILILIFIIRRVLKKRAKKKH